MIDAFSRISLVALLAVAAALELLLNRIGSHLISSTSPLRGVVDLSGAFSVYFTGVLAAAVGIWGALTLIREPKLLGLPSRTMIAIAGALFLPVAAVGTVIRLGDIIAPHLTTAFAMMVLALLTAYVGQRASLRSKLGVIYLAAPLLLHCYWLVIQQLPALAPQGELSQLPSRLFEAGEHMVVVGAFASFLFFNPLPRLSSIFEPLPLSVALLGTVLVGLLTQTSYTTAAQAAYYGLGINLPSPSFQGAIHLSALFFFVLTVTTLLLRPGHHRYTGLGLLLIALSGFQLKLPYQLLLTTVGMMVLIRAGLTAASGESEAGSSTRASASRTPRAADWKHYLERLTVCDPGTAEHVVLENISTQIVRLRGECCGVPLSVRLLAQGPRVDELEVRVGRVPSEAALATLTRKQGRRGLRVPSGRAPKVDELRVGEAGDRFVLRDRTDSVADALSLPVLRDRLARTMHGGLSLWPDEAVLYLARPLSDGWPVPVDAIAAMPGEAPLAELAELVAMVVEVARGNGVIKDDQPAEDRDGD